MADQNQKTGSELTSGVKKSINAAKKTRQAVKKAKNAAKAVGSAAGKAASGNLVGAAVDLLKNETTRRVIIIALIISLLLPIALFYAVPLALYESLVAGVQALADQWDEIYYSGDSGRVWSWIKATAGVLFGGSDESAVVEAAMSDTTAGTGDQGEAEDMQVLHNKAQAKKIYQRKIDACKDKFDIRMDAIKDKIIARGSKSIIENQIKENFEDNFGYLNDDEEREIKYKYAGYEFRFKKSKLTTRQAIQLVNMYSYQTNTSIDNIKLSGLLKWLGYNAGGDHELMFYLGDNEDITYTMDAWTGTFIPQYMIDEAGADGYEDYIDQYGCSVVDYLIVVECPNLYYIQGSPQPKETQYDENLFYDIDDYTVQYGNDNDLTRVVFNPTTGEALSCPTDPDFPYYIVHVDKHPIYDYAIGARDSGTTEFGILKRKADFQYPANMQMVSHTYHIPTISTVTTKTETIPVKYYIDVSITIRPLDTLLDMVGLWRGYLPWEEPSALAQTTP